MKTDYNLLMEEEIKKFNGKKRSILLHCCCAPCCSGVIDKLKDFSITLYFYNPNIDSEDEYNLRANELKKLATALNLKVIIEDFSKKEFLSVVDGLENEIEGGSRCEKCFRLRLEKTSNYATDFNFDYFATTLTVSPKKNANLINKIGEEVQKTSKYLVSDFKKKDGYLTSIKKSNEFGFYRQNYCGCEFSKR